MSDTLKTKQNPTKNKKPTYVNLSYSLDRFNRLYITKDEIKDLLDKSVENSQFEAGRKNGKSRTEPKRYVEH